MKKIFIIFAILFTVITPAMAETNTIASADTNKIKNTIDITKIGFHKRLDISPETQINNMFKNYQKNLNAKDVDKFMALYSENYKSTEGYTKDKLREIAEDVLKNYPDIKYDIDVVSVNVEVDNATVITQESLYASVDSNIQYIKGKGSFDAKSINIYYLKRFSNEWKIVSDFVVNEKSAIRYGFAKYVPMLLDAPALVTPEQEYTATLKINLPNDKYAAVVSIDKELSASNIANKIHETAPRGVKSSGILERVLYSNNENKNESVMATIGIVKAKASNSGLENNIEVKAEIVGVALLSSRVNVMEPQKKIDIGYNISENKGNNKESQENE